MPRKYKPLPKMRVRKTVKPTTKRTPKVAQFEYRLGTPNAWGPWTTVDTPATVRAKLHEHFEAHIPWCNRFNKDGVVAIQDAVDEVNNSIDALKIGETVGFVACIDEHTGFKVAAEAKRIASAY